MNLNHINGNGILPTFIQRKEEISGAAILQHGKKRASDMAGALSRRGALAAIVELANEGVSKTIALCYEEDTDGELANVDPVSGRLLIPCAWGRAGGRLYGLRRSEQIALNAYMRKLHDEGSAPLFLFDAMGWYLNFFEDYPSFDRAINYWRKHQLTVKAWRELSQALSNR
jgi:hypothetical protein